MRHWAPALLLLLSCQQLDIIADSNSQQVCNPACSNNQVCEQGLCTSPGLDAGTIDGGSSSTCQLPALRPNPQAELLCSGKIAYDNFRFALCTCADLATSAGLSTDAFDSRRGPYLPGSIGGGVGINGPLTIGARIKIGGDLIVSDARGITGNSAGPLQVGGNLQSGGPLQLSSSLQVARHAEISGDLRAADVDIGGQLIQPSGAALDSSGQQTIGQRREAPVAVAPPCDCDSPLDVAAYVAAQRMDNDNAVHEFDGTQLSQVQTPRTIKLPCGRLVAPQISGSAPITLQVDGPTALFVEGDIRVENDLEVEISAEGSLDIFVAGALVAAQALELGAAEQASRVRIYLGTTGSIQLDAGGTFYGNLYAPRAEISTSGPIEVFGSLFARRLAASGPISIHYDTSILEQERDCPMPVSMECTSCKQCPHAACKDGRCGACEIDSDCCPPLRCISGQCLVGPF